MRQLKYKNFSSESSILKLKKCVLHGQVFVIVYSIGTDGLDVAGVVVKECTVGTDAAVTANTRIFITNL